MTTLPARGVAAGRAPATGQDLHPSVDGIGGTIGGGVPIDRLVRSGAGRTGGVAPRAVRAGAQLVNGASGSAEPGARSLAGLVDSGQIVGVGSTVGATRLTVSGRVDGMRQVGRLGA